jgi:hypothetical protein
LTRGFIIAGAGLAALVVAAMTMRHRRERSARRALAQRRGWEVYPRSSEDLLARLRDVALMQIGHSRRIVGAYRTAGRTVAFLYVFETGFEHRRQAHHWLVAVHEARHGVGRTTLTREEWVTTAVRGPACHVLPLSNAPTPSALNGQPVAIVEDPQQWQDTSQGGPAAWFVSQPAQRTWEILPDRVVGYQPGLIQEDKLVELTAAAVELTRQLRG